MSETKNTKMGLYNRGLPKKSDQPASEGIKLLKSEMYQYQSHRFVQKLSPT